MQRRSILFAMAWLVGCAQRPRLMDEALPGQGAWRGRLALRVDGEDQSIEQNVKYYNAHFELRGDAQSGELLLSSPIGTALAELRWDEHSAVLRQSGESHDFDSLDALAQAATGAAIPIAALFDWLQGRAHDVPGWQAELGNLQAGRLRARRLALPAADLRLILEP